MCARRGGSEGARVPREGISTPRGGHLHLAAALLLGSALLVLPLGQHSARRVGESGEGSGEVRTTK